MYIYQKCGKFSWLFMTCKTLLLCISPEIDLWILLHLHLFIFIQGVAFQIFVLLHWLCTTLVTVLWVFVSIPETWRICRKKWGDCLNWWLKSKYIYKQRWTGFSFLLILWQTLFLLIYFLRFEAPWLGESTIVASNDINEDTILSLNQQVCIYKSKYKKLVYCWSVWES